MFLKTHDTGFESLLGSGNWASNSYYAILSTDGTAPDREANTEYQHIPNKLAVAGDYDHVQLAGKAVSVYLTNIVFDCNKITFTSEGTITARYMWILKGTAATPVSTDEVLGHVDTGGAFSVVDGELSFDPDSNLGLFYVPRTIEG